MEFTKIESIHQFLYKNFETFEERFTFIVLAVVLSAIFLSGIIFLHVYFERRFENIDRSGWEFKKKFLFFLNRSKFILLGIAFFTPVLVVTWQLIYITFMVRPHVISSSPAHGSTMSTAYPAYEIEFDLPVNMSSVKFNLSPEIEGKWEYEKIWGMKNLSRKVKFIPNQSVNPGQPVVIYVAGIRLWFDNDGKQHEHAIEFNSPSIPTVSKTTPINEATNFVPTDAVLFEYTSPLGDFVDIKYQISPSVQFTVEQFGPSSHKLVFAESLNQDSQYLIKTYREVRTYNLTTKEDISRGATEEISSLTFKTVSTPLLSSYSPNGTSVNPEEDIKAVFDQRMSREDVERNFTISPSVVGNISWPDENTFLFSPDSPLEKDTQYVVTFRSGIRSEVFGKTEEDITFTFKTAGRVVVENFTPINGSTGLETALTVSVAFNQEVDRESAQSLFTLSPAAAGTFSWDGNTMMYTVTGLQYYTNYTVTIQPGVRSIYGIDSDTSFTSIFGTRSNLFTLSLPWYGQQEGFTCNCAASRMVLAYYGVYLTEQQIKSGIGFSDDPNVGWVAGYGVHVGPVANFISQYRPVEIKTGWNVTDLAHEIEAGHPVILWWYNRYSQPPGAFTLPSGVTGFNGMHSEIARGFRGSADNPTAILVHDPWRQYLEYETSFFVSNWSYLNYTALVVR